jgi:hypothetical protein
MEYARLETALLKVALLVLVPISNRAVELYDRFPDSIHASERYVIHSHGIVEGDDPKPISPNMGSMISGDQQSLFSEGGFL